MDVQQAAISPIGRRGQRFRLAFPFQKSSLGSSDEKLTSAPVRYPSGWAMGLAVPRQGESKPASTGPSFNWTLVLMARSLSLSLSLDRSIPRGCVDEKEGMQEDRDVEGKIAAPQRVRRSTLRSLLAVSLGTAGRYSSSKRVAAASCLEGGRRVYQNVVSCG